MTGAHVAEVARSWIGTPYRHQASTKRIGCDCLGLIRGVWAEVLGAFPCSVPNYSADWSEANGDEALLAAATAYLRIKPLSAAAVGDVVLFRMQTGAVAKHLGVVTAVGATPKFVHAYSGHGVCENHLTGPWARRIVARFEFPERTC